MTGLGVVLGTLALIVVVIGSWLLNLLNLPGNWLLLGVTLTFAMLVPYEDDRRLAVSWTVVIVLAGLALLGEIVEFAAGAWGASRGGWRFDDRRGDRSPAASCGPRRKRGGQLDSAITGCVTAAATVA